MPIVNFARSPIHLRGQRKLWRILTNVGQFNEGLEELEIAARLDPYEYMHWANIGLMLKHVGRNQEAIEAFQNAVKINPNCSHVSSCLAKLLADSLLADSLLAASLLADSISEG